MKRAEQLLTNELVARRIWVTGRIAIIPAEIRNLQKELELLTEQLAWLDYNDERWFATRCPVFGCRETADVPKCGVLLCELHATDGPASELQAEPEKGS